MLTKGAQTLPQKDAQAFKALAKLHDSKNYKKGLKQAVQLLQKHPDHGETISMKALFELGLGEQNKALQTAKLGLLKSKMKSIFCWHTMGTIYKIKRDFLQSSKCFQNAYKFQPDNVQLLRDIAAMQIQIRDHSAHVQTRLSILKLKPNLIHNWTGFTLANHFKGDYDQMFKAFKSLDTLILTADLKPVELSHFYIYKAVACRDAGKYNLMYETLNKNKQKIKDEVIWYQLSLECAEKLNKNQQTKKFMQFLINKFPQNIQYIRRYKKIFEISSDKQLYNRMITQYKSKISKILLVSILDSQQQFKKQFSLLIKPYYQKNLVSLFAEIQVIYESVNRRWIEQVLESFRESLKTNNKYPDAEEAISPSEYLWSMYILAQHYSMKYQTLEKAHQFITEAIKHTTTVSQFYMVKAEIQYKLHKNLQALNTINQARKTDLADRYMNNICVKYLFKCHKPNTAEQVMKLFMRDQANAYELQNQWYIIQAGKSFLKQRNLHAGLRHLNFINKQFNDMWANQFDFHYYCLRKWTLREYTQLINFNDNIYADKKYMEAATYAIRYLRQYQNYILQEQLLSKKQQETSAQTQQKSKKKNKKKKKQTTQTQQLTPLQAFRKKIDYHGKQYKQTVSKNSMQQALIWAKNVVSAKFINKNNRKQNKLYGNANSQAILIFIHFDKPLLVLKSFKKILSSNSDQLQVFLITLRILVYFESYLKKEGINELTKEIIQEFLSQNYKGKSAQQYYEEILKKINAENAYLASIKVKQSQLIIKNQQSRQNYIKLYRSELQSQIANAKNNTDQLQKVFYLVHKLQYYGEFTQQFKKKLNQLFSSKTTYFTNWVEAIDKLPDSTWTMWWLSEYDIHREELDNLDLNTQSNNKNKK